MRCEDENVASDFAGSASTDEAGTAIRRLTNRAGERAEAKRPPRRASPPFHVATGAGHNIVQAAVDVSTFTEGTIHFIIAPWPKNTKPI